MRKVWLSISMLLLFALIVCGQSKEELQAQKQKAYDDLKLTRDLMEKTSAQRSSSVKQLRILQKGINARAGLITTLESELELMNRSIQETESKIGQLAIDNRKNKEEYARLIYFAYRNHTDYEKVMYILAGASISQSYQRYKYLKYISEYRMRKANEIDSLIVELDLYKDQLSLFKNEKLLALEEREEEQGKLLGQRSRKRSMIEGLKRKEFELRREVAKKRGLQRCWKRRSGKLLRRKPES